MKIIETNPDHLLEQIRRLDAVQWSRPSDRTALEIADLERRFFALTGRECPPWPHRPWPYELPK